MHSVELVRAGWLVSTTRSILVGLFFCSLSPVANAQWITDSYHEENIQLGIDRVYNLEFAEATKHFEIVKKSYPDHPSGYFFLAMVEWMRILNNFHDESGDEQFVSMLDKVISLCDKRLDKNSKDVTALFFKGGAIGFRGRLRANRGSWVLAAKDGVLALPLVRKAYELDPKNSDVLLGIGIYNYYAAIVPQFYPFVKPMMFFFPAGDREKGLDQLQLASRNAKYANVEASYFLLQNYYSYEKEYGRALELSLSLHTKFNKNPVFHRYIGRCYVSLGMWSEAEKVFLEVEKRVKQNFAGYNQYDSREAYYYLGRSSFIKGGLEKALRYLKQSNEISQGIDKSRGSGFATNAHLTIGMIYDLQKKREAAVEQYKKVLSSKLFQNSHADARRYLQTPYSRY